MHSTLSITSTWAIALLPLVSAHGYVSGVQINGGDFVEGANPNWYYLPEGTAPETPGWQALNQDNGFVEPNSFGTADIACHKSATPGATYIEADAGDTLTIFWNTWPESHKGPILNYLAKCDGAYPPVLSTPSRAPCPLTPPLDWQV